MDRNNHDYQSLKNKVRFWLITFIRGPLSLGYALYLLVYYSWSLIFYGRFINFKERQESKQQSENDSSHPKRIATEFAEAFSLSRRGNIDDLNADLPDWFLGSYSQALEKAKFEVRYLLVYLQCTLHDDTVAFEQNVLFSSAFSSFIKQNNCIVWGGNVKHAEPFQVFQLLQGTAFPFLALIYPDGSQMKLVEHISGYYSVDAILSVLQPQIDKLNPVLQARRNERERIQGERLIRQQQESAYEASLRADQEKERRIREEKQQAEQKALLHQQKLESRQLEKELKKQNLKPEPSESSQDVVKVSIKLPNSERLVRRFSQGDFMEDIYDFVDVHDLSPIPLDAEFVLVSSYPRKEFVNRTATLSELGFKGTIALLVEQV